MPARTRPCSAKSEAFTGEQVSSSEQFCSLVRRLTDSSAALSNGKRECGSEEILLDVELEGWRYLLVRTVVPSKIPADLSPREREIVRMVAEGHPNKVIAAVLSISPWTVGTHLRRIFAKYGVGSRAAMVARWLEIGKASNSRQSNSRYDRD